MKKYRLLLLSLVFIGTLLSSFHYHNNTLVDENCPSCIVKNNLDSSPDAIVTPFLDYDVLVYADIISSKLVYFLHINLSTLSRAPPKYS